MESLFHPILKSVLFLAIVNAFVITAEAQITTTNGSVSVDGSGTLAFTATRSAPIPCTPGLKAPSYTQSFYSNFVYTDGGGTTHSFPGQVRFIQLSARGTACPAAGGNSIVLSGTNFSLKVSGAAVAPVVGLNVSLFPKYYVLSVLYAPPGNQSSNGYTDTGSEAATTSIAHTFTNAGTTAVAVSAPGGSGVGVMFGSSVSSQNSSAFTVSTSQGTGTQLNSNRNPVDHTQDQIYLWLNPAVTILPTSSTTANYSVSTPIGANGQPDPMDIVNVPVAALQNPSLIPPALLMPQSRTNLAG
jgi:hypothetical protein